MDFPDELILVQRFLAGSDQGQNHYLNLMSGGKTYSFVFDSILAKKLAKQLAKQVGTFEKANGQEFDDRLDNEPMKSPFPLE